MEITIFQRLEKHLEMSCKVKCNFINSTLKYIPKRIKNTCPWEDQVHRSFTHNSQKVETIIVH